MATLRDLRNVTPFPLEPSINDQIVDAAIDAYDWPDTDAGAEAREALRAYLLAGLAGGTVHRTGTAADGSTSYWREYQPDGPLRPHRETLGVACHAIVPWTEEEADCP